MSALIGFRFVAAGNRVALAFGNHPPEQSPATLDRLVHWAGHASADPPEIFAVVARSGPRLVARFWNPDGTAEPLCGNAVRCVATALNLLGVAGRRFSLETPWARISSLAPAPGIGAIEVPLAPLTVGRDGDDVLVSVGTPHRVRRVTDLQDPIVTQLGRRWARGPRAVNATFVGKIGGTLRVRTIERGLAGETRSCGTGAIAAYLASHSETPEGRPPLCLVEFPAGDRLLVSANDRSQSLSVSGSILLEGTTRDLRVPPRLVQIPELLGG